MDEPGLMFLIKSLYNMIESDNGLPTSKLNSQMYQNLKYRIYQELNKLKEWAISNN